MHPGTSLRTVLATAAIAALVLGQASATDLTQGVCVATEPVNYCPFPPQPSCNTELKLWGSPRCDPESVLGPTSSAGSGPEAFFDDRAAGAAEDGSQVALRGLGVSKVQRFGRPETTCAGEPRMAIEASWKQSGLEPTGTIAYGGGRAPDGASNLLLPCALGHVHNILIHEVRFASPQGWAGAWSAGYVWPNEAWVLQVGAPDGSGHRWVRYDKWVPSGHDSFEGLLAEYR